MIDFIISEVGIVDWCTEELCRPILRRFLYLFFLCPVVCCYGGDLFWVLGWELWFCLITPVPGHCIHLHLNILRSTPFFAKKHNHLPVTKSYVHTKLTLFFRSLRTDRTKTVESQNINRCLKFRKKNIHIRKDF